MPVAGNRPSDDQSVSPLRAAFDALPVQPGDARVRLLEHNIEAWNARWIMLEQAQTSIDVSYFSLEKDIFGYSFLGHLLKKARTGRAVRLMTDAIADTFGQRGFKATLRGQDYLQELVQAGVPVRIYHPLYMRPRGILSWTWMASNHDKILVTDKQRCMTGGRNIGWDYYADPKDHPTAWRDTDIQIDDPSSATTMTQAFEIEFTNSHVTHKIRKDLLGNWRRRDLELIGAYVMMDLWLKDPPLTADEKTTLKSDAGVQEQTVEDLVTRAVERLPQEGISRKPSKRELKKLRDWARELLSYAQMRGRYGRFDRTQATHEGIVKILDRTSTATDRRAQIGGSLIELGQKAQKRIVIENPYVVLTEQAISSLAEIGKKGVEIYIGTNSPLSTDSALTQAFFLEDWPEVLARVPNLRIFVAAGKRKLHAKVGIMDDVLTLVSTYNLDFLSAHVNSEVAAAVWSRSFAAETMQSFLDDMGNPANEVVEYTILRDKNGTPVLKDGKPVITFGPEDHLPKEMLKQYRRQRRMANLLRRLPWFKPLRHPQLK